MSKTRFIAGLTVLAIALSIAFYGSVKVINSFGEIRVSKKHTRELKSVDAKTVLKSVNATDKLASSLNTDADKVTSDNIVVQENKVQKLVLKQKNKTQKNTIKTENKKSKNKKIVKKSKRKKKKNKNKKYRSMGTYRITAYCACGHCSSGTGITASGTRATEGRTIAADTSILPMGTKVKINGHEYTVEDRGGAVNGRHIDVYYNSHSEALDWGVRYVEVFVLR